jgi:hypothetical protein
VAEEPTPTNQRPVLLLYTPHLPPPPPPPPNFPLSPPPFSLPHPPKKSRQPRQDGVVRVADFRRRGLPCSVERVATKRKGVRSIKKRDYDK